MQKNKLKDIEKTVTELLSEYGNVKKFIKKNKSFNYIEEGFIDSLNLIFFFEKVEKKFKVKIKDEYSSSKNFGDLKFFIKYIANSIK
jgi:acyl carrier protein|tara:strand:+ start:90 stop:350 length:261 start_codon:yes stop_codon:yes gene_type:complete